MPTSVATGLPKRRNGVASFACSASVENIAEAEKARASRAAVDDDCLPAATSDGIMVWI